MAFVHREVIAACQSGGNESLCPLSHIVSVATEPEPKRDEYLFIISSKKGGQIEALASHHVML